MPFASRGRANDRGKSHSKITPYLKEVFVHMYIGL